MNWEKIKTQHYFKEPVEHIYTSSIFDSKEYDRLYENQNNLNHQHWQDFDKQYRTGFTFFEDVNDISLNNDVLCLWFFKERSDRGVSTMINLDGKLITYFPNAFLITTSKKIKFEEKQEPYIRRPVVQLDMPLDTYNSITSKFQK